MLQSIVRLNRYKSMQQKFRQEAKVPELLNQRVMKQEDYILHVVVGLVVPFHILPGKHTLEYAYYPGGE